MPLTDQAALEKEIALLDQERQELSEAKKPIDKRLIDIYHQRKALDDKLSQLKLDRDQLKLDRDGLSLGFLLDPDTSDSMVMYRARQKWCEGRPMTFSGRWTQTRQPAAVLRINYREPITELLSLINELKPHYKPIEGWVRFDMLEHSLSKSGIYNLLVSSDSDVAKIELTRYSRVSYPATGSLQEMLTYMSEYLWYEGGTTYESDDY